MTAHETGAELSRWRLPAGIARGAYDLLGRCFCKSLLPRRRGLSDLVLQLAISQDVPRVSDERVCDPRMTSDPPWKAERQLIATFARAPRTPRNLTPHQGCRLAPVEVNVPLVEFVFF